MCQAAGQKAGDEYHKGLMGHFSDCNNTVQIRQSRAEEAKADYFRAHCRSDDVGSKTYYKRGYDCVGEITVNSKKYQENQQQIRLDIQTRNGNYVDQAGLQHGN